MKLDVLIFYDTHELKIREFFERIFFAKVKRRTRLETILFESKNMQKKMLLIFDIFESNVLTSWCCRRMNYAHEWG